MMNTSHSNQKTAWQIELMNAITDPKELLSRLELDPNLLNAALAAGKHFSLKVPLSFLARIQKKNIHDPLLRQILPIAAELIEQPNYVADPLHETQTNPIPGILHKYHGRVLLTFSGTCGINCRYCFRREFAYEKNNPGQAGWDQAVEYIMQQPSINEVILSGGDPFIAPDSSLKNLIEKLATIPHLKRLRIHSRMPIALPSRITPELIDAITSHSLRTILVVHCNHPQEINQEVKEAMQPLTQAGILLLNQAVLLKGVNDHAETLITLSETLFDAGIQPYYLHLLDKVRGAAHFDLDVAHAQQLHWAVTTRLPGYLVPKLVCEQPGAPAKISFGHWELYTN